MSVMGHLPASTAASGVPEQPKRRGLAGYLLLGPGGLWLVIFFVIPTITLASSSLYDPSGSLDTGYAMTWHFQNYLDVFTRYHQYFLRSYGYALTSTVVCVVLGYPLAYAIAFKSGRWKNLMLVAVIAPFFTSFLVRTLAWKLILADHGWVVLSLQWLHVLGPDGHLLSTQIAVITGITYNFLPFMVLPLYASLERLDPRLLEAANDLYASPFTAFRKVTLPLSMPGLVAGTLLTFIPAAGDFINAALLGTPQTTMIGLIIQKLFLAFNLPAASALSVILMVSIVILVAIYVWRAGTEELV
jgi:spermidine/putrescine transport system permease protein